jgi:hypothetical protein
LALVEEGLEFLSMRFVVGSLNVDAIGSCNGVFFRGG